MIKNWSDFEKRRKNSLIYHTRGTSKSYEICLNYFELMRKYFEKNGFPVQKEKYKNGTLKPFSQKESKKQLEEIQEWIVQYRMGRIK